MREQKISDELLSRFLEGKTDGEVESEILRQITEDPDLFEEMAVVAEAAKLVDAEPINEPDLDNAEERVKKALAPAIHHLRPRFYWMAAASVTAILAVSLLWLLRPSDSNPYVADNRSDKTTELSGQKHAENRTCEPDKGVREAGQPAEQPGTGAFEGKDNSSEAVEHPEEYTAKVETANYASHAVHRLVVRKPAKSPYMVLCKNLERSFAFEWDADSVQSVRLTVTNSNGGTVADITEKDKGSYSLKYQEFYPERQLFWKLQVVFTDGVQEIRSGQIHIDYQIN